MLELRGIKGGYPGKEVLTGVDLTLRDGELLALVGPNGCGKSTLLKAALGLLPRREGLVLADGLELSTPRELARRVAYLPQSRNIPDVPVGRLALEGRFPYLSYPRRYSRSDHAAAESALRRMGLWELRETPLRELSGGTRQKAYIAMALAQDANTLLMDEPTTFLDVAHQLRLMEILRGLRSEGKAVLAVLHDLPLAFAHADRLAVMDMGRVVDTGSPQEVFRRGSAERVFGVKLTRVVADGNARYFCELQHAGQLLKNR